MVAAETRPSKKQQALLSYIDGFIKANGYGPSYREVMRALDYKSVSTVAIHIDNLIVKGYLEKKDHSARSLAVLNSIYTDTPDNTAAVSEHQSKWLVEQISKKFAAYDQSSKAKDDIYVLVGALHVLGLDAAARSFKERLARL